MCQARNYSMYRIWYHHQSEHSNQQILINNNKIQNNNDNKRKPKPECVKQKLMSNLIKSKHKI